MAEHGDRGLHLIVVGSDGPAKHGIDTQCAEVVSTLQLKYEKRFSQGLSMVAHYTFSKMLTEADVAGGDVSWLGGSSTLQSWSNLHLEKSYSAFDIPHRAVVSFDYQLPFGRGRAFGSDMHKLVNGVLGGWEMSGILTFSQGFPIAPTLSSGTLWEGNQRPNLIGDPRMEGSAFERMNRYFNVSAFSQPPPDVIGTAPRTLNYRAPGITNADLTLMKNFAVSEHKSFQFRLEAYNFTNSPTFGAPNAAFGGSSFGIISAYAGGRGARTVQVAVKFYY